MNDNNRGSATVESCVIVPIFLFFLLGISYMFMLIMTDAHIHQSLAEASIYGAQYCYFEDRLSSGAGIMDTVGESGSSAAKTVLNTAVIYKQFRTYLGADTMVERIVSGGVNGIIITAIPDNENPKVFIARADYIVKLNIPVLGDRIKKRAVSVKQKACLGFTGEEAIDDSDVYVYITPNQSVYHVSRSCTHLSLKVRTYSGHGDYPPCSFCGNDETSGAVYIAENGTVYHNNVHCLGLKRTVSRVKKSSVAGLKPCSRCGK